MLEMLIAVRVAGLPASAPLLQFTEDVTGVRFALDEAVEAGTLYLIRPDGATCAVPLEGTQQLTGTIPAAATELPGRLRFALRVTQGGTSRVCWYAESTVRQTATGETASVGTLNVQQLEALIDRCDKIVNGGVGGVYPTLAALQAAVPQPLKGESYLIGSAYPYTRYTWDAVGEAWVMTATVADHPIVDTVTSAPQSLASGTATTFTVSVAKPGYIPLGIVGVSPSGTGVRMCCLIRHIINGDVAEMIVNNAHTAAITATYTLSVLYMPAA